MEKIFIIILKRLLLSENYRIVSNSINSSLYHKSNKAKIIKKNKDYFYIGYIGRVVSSKNIPHLIEIFSNLKKIIPRTKLYVVGDGADLDKITDLKDKLSLEVQWKLLDIRLTSVLIIVFLIFLFPSGYEGMPNSILEAMSIGLPVIGYDVSGVNDIIKNGINGVLVNMVTKLALQKKLKN